MADDVDLVYPLQFAHWAVCTTGIAASMLLTAVVLLLRPRRAPLPPGGLPPVTVLKPFDGVDPGLEDNLWTYLSTPYPAPRQVLLCTDGANEDGIAAARAALERLRDEPVEGLEAELLLSTAGDSAPVNRKIWHLDRGLARALHPVVVSGDSGTRLEATTLVELVSTLVAQPRRGLAWAPYTGDGVGGLGARLTRLAFSASSLNFFVIAVLHRVMRLGVFSAGGLFAVRRDALDEVGGFRAYADVLAEDIHLARHLEDAGWGVAISPVPVVQHPGRATLGDFYRRLVRWTFIMWRYRDPLRIHVPMVLCALPLSLVTWPLATLAYPEQALQFGLLTLGLWLARIGYGYAVLGVLSRRPLTADLVWGTPLMEAVLMLAYVRSFFMRTVRWRDQDLAVQKGGKMAPFRG